VNITAGRADAGDVDERLHVGLLCQPDIRNSERTGLELGGYAEGGTTLFVLSHTAVLAKHFACDQRVGGN